jgi:hypothetical protein
MHQVKIRRKTLEKFRLYREEESFRNYNFHPHINQISQNLAQNRSQYEEKVEDYLIRKGKENKHKLKNQFINKKFEEDIKYNFHPKINRRSCQLSKKRVQNKITFGWSNEKEKRDSEEHSQTYFIHGKKLSKAMSQILIDQQAKMPFHPKINPKTELFIQNSKMKDLDFLSRQDRFLKEKKKKVHMIKNEQRLKDTDLCFFKRKTKTNFSEKNLYQKAIQKQIREEQKMERIKLKEIDKRNRKKTLSKSEQIIFKKKEAVMDKIFWELSGKGQVSRIGADNAHIDEFTDDVLSKGE